MRRDGSVAWVRDEGVLVYDEAGKPLCIQGYILDITDQKMRVAALLESEAIVGSAFDSIVARSPDGLVTSWNSAAERIFGYSAEEMIGRAVELLLPGDSDLLRHIDERLSKGERVDPLEAVCVRKDGKLIHVESTISPIFDATGAVIGSASTARDISERKRAQALAAGQAQLLEFVAGGAPLPEVLDRLAGFVEAHGDGVLASILLLDRDGVHLRHGAAPSLPASYCEAIDGIAIGPSVGSCGTAAYRRERVAVSDIASDPLWADFCDLALDAGLRACWSTPIFATGGALLGTFALYYREARASGGDDIELVELATHVAGIAIERARSEEAARASEARYRDLFENANEPIATVTMDEVITEVNSAFERVLGYSREELIGTSLDDYLTPEGREMSARATAEALRRDLGHDVRAGVHRRGRAHGDARRVEPRDRGGGPPDRLPGHLPRHHGAQAGGVRAAAAVGAEPPPGAPRSPHGPPEPRVLRAAGRARDQRRRRRWLATRRAAHGSRPLQGDQRHAGAPLRRPAAGRAQPASRVGAAPQRHGREAGRRRVRHPRPPAFRVRDRSRPGARAHPRRARVAVRGRWPAAPRRGQHRRGALPRARPRRRRAPAARGCRDVRGQGDRSAACPLRRGARPPRHGEPQAALGAAARDSRPRARAVLPAQARHPHGRDRRRRGAHALAASDARTDRAGRVRPGGREDGPDRAAHPLRPRRGARPARALERRGPPAARGRQPLDAKPARPDPPRAGRGPPGQVEAAGRAAHRRAHGERDHLGSGEDVRQHSPAHGARRRRRDRRLRDGLHLARLPGAARDHPAQDRQVVRAQHVQPGRRRRDRALDHHARPRPRPRGGRRGRRDEGDLRPARAARLRQGPGLLAEPPDPARRADRVARHPQPIGEAAA